MAHRCSGYLHHVEQSKKLVLITMQWDMLIKIIYMTIEAFNLFKLSLLVYISKSTQLTASTL